MKSLSSKINDNQYKTIDNLYKAFKAEVKNPNLKALYKTKLLTISVFKNNTLLLQGDEKAIFAFNKQVIDGQEKPAVKKTKSKAIALDGTIGMDEVGTGDYFGPVVTCSCYLPNKNIEAVKALGVDDSKKIDDKNIVAIAKALNKYVICSINICAPRKYNELIDKYDNNNIVKAIYHNEALANLIDKLDSKLNYQIILDQFVSRDNYYKYLKQAKVDAKNIDTIEVKAEGKYLAVACASVAARAVFLKNWAGLEKDCGCKLPKGAVKTQEIVDAGKKIIKKHNLADYAKLHFDSITNKINN